MSKKNHIERPLAFTIDPKIFEIIETIFIFKFFIIFILCFKLKKYIT